MRTILSSAPSALNLTIEGETNMKTTMATVQLVLRTNKTLADGSHPIMLRVQWKGRKERSTGFACKEADWDKKHQLLKPKTLNAQTINKKLTMMLETAKARALEYAASGDAYTAADILAEDERKDSGTYAELVEKYIAAHTLRRNTRDSYHNSKAALEKIFGKDFLLEKLDTDMMLKGLNGTGKVYINCAKAVARWALQRGLITTDPFRFFSLPKTYKTSRRVYYLAPETYAYVERYFKSLFLNDFMAELDAPLLGIISFKQDMVEKLRKGRLQLVALFMFVFIYRLQGLSPIDVLSLERQSVKIIKYKGKEFYSINTMRHKTGVPVPLRVPKSDISDILFSLAAEMHPNGRYLLPYLDGMNEDERHKKVKSYNIHLSNFLRKILAKVNEIIAKDNETSGRDVPLVNTEEICMYTARHTYASHYLQRPNSSLQALCTLMGRSIQGIATYVHQLSSESEILDAIE